MKSHLVLLALLLVFPPVVADDDDSDDRRARAGGGDNYVVKDSSDHPKKVGTVVSVTADIVQVRFSFQDRKAIVPLDPNGFHIPVVGWPPFVLLYEEHDCPNFGPVFTRAELVPDAWMPPAVLIAPDPGDMAARIPYQRKADVEPGPMGFRSGLFPWGFCENFGPDPWEFWAVELEPIAVGSCHPRDLHHPNCYVPPFRLIRK